VQPTLFKDSAKVHKNNQLHAFKLPRIKTEIGFSLSLFRKNPNAERLQVDNFAAWIS